MSRTTFSSAVAGDEASASASASGAAGMEVVVFVGVAETVAEGRRYSWVRERIMLRSWGWVSLGGVLVGGGEGDDELHLCI